MLYQRFKDAVRRCRNGDWQRWGLLRGRLSLTLCRELPKVAASGGTATGRVDGLPTLFASLIAVIAATMVSTTRGDEPLTLLPPGVAGSSAATSPPLTVSEGQARASIQWLADLALREMPRSFAGDKDWGDTTKLWAGVRVRRDGWKLKTHRRFREVEQGRWVKYEATLPDPSAPNAVTATVHDVAAVTDPASGEQRWQIQSSIVAPMQFTARVQRWNVGVKLFSMTITGELRIRLISTASVGFVADYAEIPPALVIDPRIDQAQLVLERFEVNRISHIGGDVAEQWGELIQEILVERFVKKQNDRLVGKLNDSIEKKRGDLRVSMAEWFTSW